MPKFIVGAASHPGQRKTVNEDAYSFYPPEDGREHPKGMLLALADGMGGRAGGGQASQIAVDTLMKAFYEDSAGDIGESLERAFHAAHEAVVEEGKKDIQVQGMATTLTAVVILKDRLYHAHVGDSRAYLIDGNTMTCITEDHSFVASLVKAGAITEEQARTHPQRNLVTQAVGASEELTIDRSRRPRRLKNGNGILLCCDGLYKDLTDDEILETIRSAPDPSDSCEKLIQRANDRGGSDNITAVLTWVEEIGGLANTMRRIIGL
jgi:protein phosphatase